jgi:hypothetical protein
MIHIDAGEREFKKKLLQTPGGSPNLRMSACGPLRLRITGTGAETGFPPQSLIVSPREGIRCPA